MQSRITIFSQSVEGVKPRYLLNSLFSGNHLIGHLAHLDSNTSWARHLSARKIFHAEQYIYIHGVLFYCQTFIVFCFFLGSIMNHN
jgi:hypothetical protein